MPEPDRVLAVEEQRGRSSRQSQHRRRAAARRARASRAVAADGGQRDAGEQATPPCTSAAPRGRAAAVAARNALAPASRGRRAGSRAPARGRPRPARWRDARGRAARRCPSSSSSALRRFASPWSGHGLPSARVAERSTSAPAAAPRRPRLRPRPGDHVRRRREPLDPAARAALKRRLLQAAPWRPPSAGRCRGTSRRAAPSACRCRPGVVEARPCRASSSERRRRRRRGRAGRGRRPGRRGRQAAVFGVAALDLGVGHTCRWRRGRRRSRTARRRRPRDAARRAEQALEHCGAARSAVSLRSCGKGYSAASTSGAGTPSLRPCGRPRRGRARRR